MRRIVLAILISGLLFLVGCGGSGSNAGNGGGGNGGGGGTNGGTSVAGGNTIVPLGAANVAPLTVDSFNGDDNIPYTTVQVCVPGTVYPGTANPNCVTINHIMVDTGSTGLRIPTSVFSNPNFANGATVLAALQNVNPGTPVAECYSFLSGNFFWGSVRSADVYMGGTSNIGEKAAGVPIHVIGDQPRNSAPSDCSDDSPNGEDDTAFGTNGFLGAGNFQYDCDALGFSNSCSSNTPPPGMYYTCPGGVCSVPSVSLAEQVRNPVSLFTSTGDTNGVIVELPAVTAGVGQASILTGAAWSSASARKPTMGLAAALPS